MTRALVGTVALVALLGVTIHALVVNLLTLPQQAPRDQAVTAVAAYPYTQGGKPWPS